VSTERVVAQPADRGLAAVRCSCTASRARSSRAARWSTSSTGTDSEVLPGDAGGRRGAAQRSAGAVPTERLDGLHLPDACERARASSTRS
jgi:hypothetical protein